MRTPYARAFTGCLKRGDKNIDATIKDMFNRIGVMAGMLNTS